MKLKNLTPPNIGTHVTLTTDHRTGRIVGYAACLIDGRTDLLAVVLLDKSCRFWDEDHTVYTRGLVAHPDNIIEDDTVEVSQNELEL